MASVLDIARAYVAAGLSVIPIRPDGSKAPAVAWKEYQTRRATDAELVQWFGDGTKGIAIICGAVSGNLEVLDFDDAGAYRQWTGKMQQTKPGMLEELTIVATPRPGHHVYVRRQLQPLGNRDLAGTVLFDAHGTTTTKTLIETRGEGGYVLAPGSPLACHVTGKPYLHVSGPPLTAIVTQRGELQ